MNKEDYISFEVAKLLKEKGFNEVCNAGYFIEDKDINPFLYGTYQNKGECYVSGFIAAPSLYEAQKWLRNNKNILVSVRKSCAGWFSFLEYADSGHCIINEESKIDSPLTSDFYNTYEEALNAGIFEALRYE